MKVFKKNHRKGILIVFFLFAFVISLSSFHPAKSNTIDKITGFAYEGWTITDEDDPPNSGPAGMEWLSFNCTNAGSDCNQSNFGVTIGDDNYITGFAWSPHYGWAKFGGFDPDDFPSGAGTTQDNLKRVPDGSGGYTVEGWFRFCAFAQSPNTCNGNASANWSNGGGDGWVATNGNWANPVTIAANGEFDGFAWGGNVDGSNSIGWIDFSDVLYTNLTDPVVFLTADPNPIPVGGSTTLSWQGLNLDTAHRCDASDGSGTWPGLASKDSPLPGKKVTFDVGPFTTAGDYDYTIVCYGDGDVPTLPSTVTIKAGIQVDLFASPSSVLPGGGSHTTLKWRAIPSSVTLENCVADSAPTPNNLNVAEVPTWKGSTLVSPNNVTPGSKAGVAVPYNPTRYMITCYDPSNPTIPITDIEPVSWTPPPKASVELRNTKIKCTPPLPDPSADCTTTLSWQSDYIVPGSCRAYASDTGTNWNTLPTGDIKTDSGSQTNIKVTKTSPLTTEFKITCDAISGGEVFSNLFLHNTSGSGSKKKYKEN